MSNLKIEGRSHITIGQSILDYILAHRNRFQNKIPPLGARWKVRHTHFNRQWGCDVVNITNEDGDWMTLPKNII